MKAENWMDRLRREEREHAAEVSYASWRAGLGADQHPDEVANSFNRGVTPAQFVREKVEARNRRRAMEQEERWEAERQEQEQHELTELRRECAEDGHPIQDDGYCPCGEVSDAT